MIKPFLTEELFRINDGLTPEFDGEVICIDNFYKNYEDIHKMLTNSWIPNWKITPEGRNFIDYYDCRVVLQNQHISEMDKLKLISLVELISYFFNDSKEIGIADYCYHFNFFKNIKMNVPNNLQHHPHVDGSYNAIVFLDKHSSGGTAIYPEMKNVINCEEKNLLKDISNEPKKIIKAVPNRLVIFKGDLYHGGYVEDHNIYTDENWRINQVMFFGSNE